MDDVTSETGTFETDGTWDVDSVTSASSAGDAADAVDFQPDLRGVLMRLVHGQSVENIIAKREKVTSINPAFDVQVSDIPYLDHLLCHDMLTHGVHVDLEILLGGVDVSGLEPAQGIGINEIPTVDGHEISKKDFDGYVQALNMLQKFQSMVIKDSGRELLLQNGVFKSWRDKWRSGVAKRLAE
ncbi:hypothetical protein BSKO_02833 [Bryopsis sp. KO-2023]|nr:hypothetical protein BSKO_02824 [Bryopsis sp. KO-2023]GMH34972.1 hypothetical protein BSKO_02833 [Bryopsis sp. KO-2023]